MNTVSHNLLFHLNFDSMLLDMECVMYAPLKFHSVHPMKFNYFCYEIAPGGSPSPV